MRLKSMVLHEFRFLMKYGIIAIYVIFTLVYLGFLSAIPKSARSVTAMILIFTDPAAMGLFFMGAVILLEKSQHIESSLGVSPVKISEYILAKCVPMMIIGTIVALVIGITAGVAALPGLVSGVGLSSFVFSLCGLFVASNIRTLNGFMIAVVPFEIFLCVPAILYLFGILKGSYYFLHPGIAAISLISGENSMWILKMISLCIWTVAAFILCEKAVMKSFASMGGAKI